MGDSDGSLRCKCMGFNDRHLIAGFSEDIQLESMERRETVGRLVVSL